MRTSENTPRCFHSPVFSAILIVSNQMIREGTRREMTSVAVWKGIQLVSQMQSAPVRLARDDELHVVFRRSASCKGVRRFFLGE